MPTYEYHAINPRTGAVVADLPLYGVNADKVLSGAGNFVGTFKLHSEKFDDVRLLDSTTPGNFGIGITRDGVGVWAGIIWSRTYSTEADTVQLTGQTYESVFSHVAIRTDWQVTADDRDLWAAVLTNMQAQESGAFNFGIVFNTPAATTLLRRVDYLAAEFRYWEEAVRELSEYSDGYGYTIDTAYYSSNPKYGFNFTCVRNGVTLAPYYPITYEYPGQISKFWFSENASRGGVRHTGRASSLAPGAQMPSHTVDNTDLTAAGWIPWHNVEMFNDPTSDDDLIKRTEKMAADDKMPIPTPTVELGPNHGFDAWNQIGKKVKFYIAPGARFPTGHTFDDQLRGWSLTPETANGPEVLRLQLRGDG